MYKLISCWGFIIIVCLLFVGSLGSAQGQDYIPSGWEKVHKEAIEKVEAAEKEVMVKAEMKLWQLPLWQSQRKRQQRQMKR